MLPAMVGTVRGLFTLAGAAGAGVLIWIATQIGQGTLGGYWSVQGLFTGAGLTMALSQLFGGWTKWGWPHISGRVFLIGFLPAFAAAGWVLLAGQPEANWFQRHLSDWSSSIGIEGLVNDLRGYLAVLAFGLGLVFGFTFDTKGPLPPPSIGLRRREPEEPRPEPEPEPAAVAPVPSELPSASEHPPTTS